MSNSVVVGVGFGVGVLALAGVGFYLLFEKSKESQTTRVTPVIPFETNSLNIGNGVVAAVGPSVSNIEAQLQADQLKEAAWRKTDKLYQLDRDWADMDSRIKILHAELDKIDHGLMPIEIRSKVVKECESKCWSNRPAFSPFWDCNYCNDIENAENGKWKLRADELFNAQKDNDKKPHLAQLDQLRSQMSSLIANYAALGINKQPLTVRIT